MADALRARLADKGLQIVPWYQLADFYNKTVALFSKQVAVMKLIIAVIIILSISNTLTMSVLERTGEIGTSMALGIKRAQILAQFVGEGAIIGVIGGVVGVGLGLLLAFAISAFGIPMPPPPGMARSFVGEVRVTAVARGRGVRPGDRDDARGKPLPRLEGLAHGDRERPAPQPMRAVDAASGRKRRRSTAWRPATSCASGRARR